MRVLVTVEPRMYREALAAVLHEHRPGDEVVLTPPAAGGRLANFVPDLLVSNDTDGALPEALEGTARIEVLYSDGMDARVVVDGRSRRRRT